MYEDYKKLASKRIKFYSRNKKIKNFVKQFYLKVVEIDYWKNFFWFGVPIFQAPMDLQAYQEIIWEVKPDLIIETGIKYGGSLLYSATMLAALEKAGVIDKGDVLGIDIRLPKGILSHPLMKMITMLKGSSTDKNIVKQVYEFSKNKKRILIILDSYHSHNHVLGELKAYSPLVSVGSYIIVNDTGVQDLVNYPRNARSQWRVGDNPKTAVWEFMKNNKEFIIDKFIETKVLFTAYPDGYLKRIK